MAECVISSINPNSGSSGTIVTLKGTIATAGGLYHIHWKSIDTEPLKTGKTTGYKFSDSLAIPPSVQGNYQIIVEDVATGAFSGVQVRVVPWITMRVIPWIAIDPATAPVGAEVIVSGSSFPSGKASIRYDDQEVATAIADTEGSFQVFFKIPARIAGEHKITTKPVSTVKTFTIIPTVVIQPTSGVVGTKIGITGRGFPPQRVSIKYDDVEVSTATANDRGNFQATFELPPSSEGKHRLVTEPASTVETLTVTPKIAIEPVSGFAATKVILSGAGFSPGEISIRYDNKEVAKVAAGNKGNFQITFEVPPSVAGEHRVTTEPASTVETFTIVPKIAVDLALGHVGTRMGLSGTGFPPGKVSIWYDDREVATATADKNGSVWLTFEVSSSIVGEHQITTQPTSTVETFTVTPKLTIEPGSGVVGTEVTVTGTGFPPREVSVRYGGDEVGTSVVHTRGGFKVSFKVPASIAGEHKITTSLDLSVESFTVNPAFSVEPDTGPVGTKVTVKGTGFPLGEVAIWYDALEVATTIADDRGNFDVTLEVPPSTAGQHQITIKPALVTKVFAVIPKISLSPSQGIGPSTVVGSGFPACSKVTIATGATVLPSVPADAVTDSDGSFTAIITIPATASGNYVVTAQSGESNASNIFTVKTPRAYGCALAMVVAVAIGATIIAVLIAVLR